MSTDAPDKKACDPAEEWSSDTQSPSNDAAQDAGAGPDAAARANTADSLGVPTRLDAAERLDEPVRQDVTAPLNAPVNLESPPPGTPPFPMDSGSDEMVALKNLEERRKRAKRKRIVKIAVACGIAAVVLVALVVPRLASAPVESAEPKAQTAVVTREAVTSSVQATGALKPGAHVAVTPEVSGVIQEVMVSEGQQVQEGDVLFTLKNSEIDKTVNQAEIALGRAQRNVDKAQENVSDAWGTYNEAVDAYNEAVDVANEATEEAPDIAQQAYDQAYKAAVAKIPSTATEQERKQMLASAEEAAQAAYDEVIAAAASTDPGSFDDSSYLMSIDAAQEAEVSAEDSLQDAQRNYDSALQEAEKRTVHAPRSGTVLDLKAVPGAAVGGASGGTSQVSEALMQIADVSTLSIDIQVNEVDIANVAVGQHATVTFTAVPGLEMGGRVASVASVSTGSSEATGGQANATGVVTFKVTVVLDGTDERLKPGMSASVSILTKNIADALVIPTTALVEGDGKTQVFVVTDEKTLDGSMREVTVTDRTGSQAVIGSGLEEGEIVLAGTGADGASGSASASSASSSSA